MKNTVIPILLYVHICTHIPIKENTEMTFTKMLIQATYECQYNK